jgi:hypothetical protein
MSASVYNDNGQDTACKNSSLAATRCALILKYKPETDTSFCN